MSTDISNNTKPETSSADDFAREAAKKQTGFFSELLGYLAQNKKWWLAPIIITLLLVGGLIILGGTGAAPLIYTLF